jgi:transcriptional regulator GlxA family with amidase domain
METSPQIKVAVMIYNGVELVDMNGPIDVFVHANAYNNKRYQVYTVAATSDPIRSESNIVTIVPQYDICNCPQPDIIVIPGIIDLEVDAAMIKWLTEVGNNHPELVFLSVCIGLYTLAQTGLLSGKKATTHYLAINEFHKLYPDVTIVKNIRFWEDGRIVSTGGITSGIDGALHLVEKYDGAIVAQQTADVMIYNRDAPLPPFTILPPYFSI